MIRLAKSKCEKVRHLASTAVGTLIPFGRCTGSVCLRALYINWQRLSYLRQAEGRCLGKLGIRR
jgi:hypothetical protein